MFFINCELSWSIVTICMTFKTAEEKRFTNKSIYPSTRSNIIELHSVPSRFGLKAII